MKILFIGYSNLFKKRIMPILERLPEITKVEVAKYDSQLWDFEYKKIKHFKGYNNYDEAFKFSNADIAYISSVNSDHFGSAKRAIERGFHTIVDKPATTSLVGLNILLELAKKKNVLLAESTVYTYHPNVIKIKNIFEEEKSQIKNINTIFSFPPLDPNNFRYNKELGGGAINDTGPYAASLGRFFFNEIPERVYCHKVISKNNLDIAYTLLMKYSENKTLNGYFGFTTEYTNEAFLLANNLSISIERIFTTPEDLLVPINIKSNNNIFVKYTRKENSFLMFFREILSAIQNKNYEKFRNDMYMDGKTLEMIRKPFN